MDEQKTTLYIDKGLYTKMKHYCIEHDVSIKDFVNNLIKEKLNNN